MLQSLNKSAVSTMENTRVMLIVLHIRTMFSFCGFANAVASEQWKSEAETLGKLAALSKEEPSTEPSGSPHLDLGTPVRCCSSICPCLLQAEQLWFGCLIISFLVSSIFAANK